MLPSFPLQDEYIIKLYKMSITFFTFFCVCSFLKGLQCKLVHLFVLDFGVFDLFFKRLFVFIVLYIIGYTRSYYNTYNIGELLFVLLCMQTNVLFFSIEFFWRIFVCFYRGCVFYRTRNEQGEG